MANKILEFLPTDSREEKSRKFIEYIHSDAWAKEDVFVDENGKVITGSIGATPKESAEKETGNWFTNGIKSAVNTMDEAFVKTDLYKKYFITEENRLKEAKKIAETTGIPAGAILYSDENFRKALDIYNYTEKKKEIAGNKMINMEEIFQDIPGLKDLAQKDTISAAIALHDIKNIRETQGIIDAAESMWKTGRDNLRRGEIGAKAYKSDLTEEDYKELAEIEERIKKSKVLPNFLSSPMQSIVGGVAGSAPLFLDSGWKGQAVGVGLGAVSAALGAAIAAPTGAGAAIAARSGFSAGYRIGSRYGMATSMWENIAGNNYLDFKNLKKPDGTSLLSDGEARAYAAIGAAIETGIEMADYGLIENALKGTVHQQAVKNIIQNAKDNESAQAALKSYVQKNIANAVKVAGAETLEEGAQSVGNDLVHNWVVNDKNAESYIPKYNWNEIGQNAIDSMQEAAPAAIGFGAMTGIGGSVGIGRHLRTIYNEREQIQESTYRNNVASEMTRQIIGVLKESKLNKDTPEISRKMLDNQLKNTDYTNVYVDVEMVMKEENGREILDAVAKAANIEKDELDMAIRNNGQLVLPTSTYAQLAAQTGIDILDNASFNENSVAPSRAKEELIKVNEEIKSIQNEDRKKEVELTEALIRTHFPLEGKEQDLAAEIIYKNPQNPSAAYKETYDYYVEQEKEILFPILQELSNGMGKGVDIIETVDGKGQRVSNNDKWYSDFYKKNNRPPTKQELKDIAYDIATGADNAPEIMGWRATTPEEIEYFKETKRNLDDIRENIQALGTIKEKIKTFTSSEIAISKGLSQEGYSVYNSVVNRLKESPNVKVKISARMNAILLARHADRIASIVQESGNKDYTARDYALKRFGIDFGDKKNEGYSQKQADSVEAKLLEDQNNFAKKIDNFMGGTLKGEKTINVMTTPLVMKLAGAKIFPIKIDVTILNKILKGKHANEINDNILKQMPRAIADPLMILKSFDKNGKQVENEMIIVLPLKNTNGSTIMAPFVLDVKKGEYKVNAIKSFYGRESNGVPNDNWFLKQIKNNGLLYINHEKTTKWSQTLAQYIGLSSLKSNSGLLINSIPNEMDLIKFKKENPSYYQENNNIQGQISDLNGKKVITLFENADESTFAHEMGHLFLMDLEEMASMGNVPEWVLKDYETVKEFVSWEKGKANEYKNSPFAKEFSKLEQDIISAKENGDVKTYEELTDRFKQERFARAFEIYLRSGEAPVTGLKSVFRKFKQWLTKLYKDYIQIGGRASKEVEAVMSRMIASNEEIELASKISKFDDFEKAGGAKILDKSEKEIWEYWVSESKAEAEEKLLKEIMKDLTVEERAKREELLEQKRNEIRDDLQKEKEFAAEAAVEKTGDNKSSLLFFDSVEEYKEALKKAGGGIEQVIEDKVREYEKFLDQYAPFMNQEKLSQEAQKLLHTSKYKGQFVSLEYKALAKRQSSLTRITPKTIDKIDHLEKMVNDFDFQDIDLGAEGSKTLKKIRSRIMEIKYSAKWNREELNILEDMKGEIDKNLVEKQIHNLKQKIRENQKAAREIRDEAIGTAETYRKAAQNTMAKMPIRDAINVSKWARQEREKVQLVNKMLAAGNYNAAMQAKRHQLLASAYLEQAFKNKEKVDKVVKRLKQQCTSKVKLPATERYYHNHLAYVFGIIPKDAFVPQNGLQEKLRDVLEKMNENLDVFGVPEWVVDASLIADQTKEMKGYTGLTMQELEDVSNVLKVLYTVGKDKFKLKTIEGKEIKDAAMEIAESTNKAIPKDIKQNAVRDNDGEMGKYLNSIIKMETFMSIMDGYKDGAATEYIFNTIAKADLKEGEMRPQAQKRLENIMKSYSTKERIRMRLDKVYQFKDEKITKEELLCFALNYGNKTNRDRLLGGFNMTEPEARNLLKHLDKKDWQFVQDTWDFINEYWNETVAIEERMNGVTLQKVEAEPFTVVGENGEVHELQGGYYPLKYNLDKESRSADYATDSNARAGMSGYAALGTGRGFTKNRSEGDINKKVLLKFTVIPEHLDNVIHNITHREAVRDVYRLVTDKNFEAVIRQKFGGRTHQMMKEWVIDNWRTQSKPNGFANLFTENTLSKLRSNAVVAIMGYRMSTSLLNAANIAPMMDELGAVNTMQAVSEYYSSPIKNRKFVLEKSNFLRERVTNLDRDLREANNTLYPSRIPIADSIKRHAFDFITETDLMLSLPTWQHVYKETVNSEFKKGNVDKNAIEEKAILAADRAVRSIFGSGKNKDLAAIQKGGELVKGLTVFYSFFNVQLNAIMKAYYQGRNLGNWQPLIRTVAYRLVVMSLLETVLRECIINSGDDKDDKYGFIKTYAQNLAGSATGGLWGIRDVSNIALNYIFDGTDYGRGFQMSLATQIVDRGRAAVKTYQSVFKDEEKKKKKKSAKDLIDLGRDVNKAVNAGFGVSDTLTDAVWTTMKYMSDEDYNLTLDNYLREILFDKKPKSETQKKKEAKKKEKERREKEQRKDYAK